LDSLIHACGEASAERLDGVTQKRRKGGEEGERGKLEQDKVKL
jgi:hypothetical protein